MAAPGTHSMLLPPTAMDARWWILHTENFLGPGGPWRVRWTALDNSPDGREVHWSSSIVWVLGGLSKMAGAAMGKPAFTVVGQASFWLGPATLLAGLALMGWIASRVFSPVPIGAFLLVFAIQPSLYQCFRPGETDHHGLAAVLAASSVLALLAGGAGLVSTKKHKTGFLPPPPGAARWFRFSGFLGSAALWVSASSFLPVLAATGAGAIAAFLARDRSATAAAPGLWRAWSRAGCCGSLFFYLIEYFPNHMGMRLEVNHPLYALAWLGGGDILARALEAMAGGRPFQGKRARGTVAWTFLSALAVALPAALANWPQSRFFAVSDRFLLLLHNRFIQEFQTLPKAMEEGGALNIALEWFPVPVFVLAAAAALARIGALRGPWGPGLALAAAPALAMQALAFWQVRWVVPAMALWLVCALAALEAAQRSGRGKAALSGFAVCAAAAAFPLPAGVFASLARGGDTQLPKSAIPALIARDVSHRLRQASPAAVPTVLSGPTTSTELNYYGGLRTLGTLYWENLEGLKRAAGIFAAASEGECRKLIENAAVTHILVTTWDDFGNAYVSLLGESGQKVPAGGETFIGRVLAGTESPQWLRPLYYPIPETFGIPGESLRLFAVAPSQTPAQALMHRGIYAFDSGEHSAAALLFAEAASLNPREPGLQGWISENQAKLKK